MTADMSATRALVVLAGILALATPAHAHAADGTPAAAKTSTKKAKTEAAEPTTLETLKERIEGEDVRDFRSFCDTWMRKLADRTTHNVANIVWTKGGPGVVGEYVSYGTDRTCIAKEDPGKVPIGKITYRETKYRKEGVSETVAHGAAGTIVEQTDVTEIFRFAKGRWQY